MIRHRVIPTLLISNGCLVKTVQFESPRYLGDPINAIKIFNEKNVDELCIMDIDASRENRNPDYFLLEQMASEAFMPLSYGGGIRTIDQIKQVFRIGYEKVVINSAAYKNTKLIKEASAYFGCQSIMCAIDYKKTLFGYRCYINDGRKRTKSHPLDVAKSYEENGAGELLVYSIDRDGNRVGYDLNMLRSITREVNIPVIACGGAGSIQDMKEAVDEGVDAIAAGSMFVYYGDKQAVLINYPEEREFIKNGIYN